MESRILLSPINTRPSKAFYYLAVMGLSFSHIITAIWWIKWSVWDYFKEDYYRANCYSFLENCTQLSFVDIAPMKAVIYFYLVLSILIFIPIFLRQRKIFYTLFVFLFLLKASLFLSRYNLMGNYHTMHLALIIAFLLSTKRSFFYRFALCLQYFGAGTLKLNLEWLSGAALVKYPGILNGQAYLWSLSYVVILELLLCWGVLFKNITIRRVTLVQLILFHAYSFFIVGAFYPLIMLGILIPLIAEDFLDLEYDPVLLKDYFRSFNLPVVTFLFVFVIYNGSVKFLDVDPSKDGTLRSLTLNMLDAKLSCNTKLIQKFENGDVRTLNLPPLDSSIRVRCDSIVFESYLKKLCREISKDKVLSKLYFHLETRRFTEEKFDTVRQIKDVCEK